MRDLEVRWVERLLVLACRRSLGVGQSEDLLVYCLSCRQTVWEQRTWHQTAVEQAGVLLVANPLVRVALVRVAFGPHSEQAWEQKPCQQTAAEQGDARLAANPLMARAFGPQSAQAKPHALLQGQELLGPEEAWLPLRGQAEALAAASRPLLKQRRAGGPQSLRALGVLPAGSRPYCLRCPLASHWAHALGSDLRKLQRREILLERRSDHLCACGRLVEAACFGDPPPRLQHQPK